MNQPLKSAATLFTVEEFATAYLIFTRDEMEARTLAGLTVESSGGIVYDKEHILFSVMATISDDCAIRVGVLRGQSPAEALAWRNEFVRANGPPSTWEIVKDYDENPESGQ